MSFHYAECHDDAGCHYDECHYAECHNAECHYAVILSVVTPLTLGAQLSG